MALFQILEKVAAFAVAVISALGYPGIFFLMALESSMTPVASEMVMPFAGFLASQGEFNIILAILAGGFGSLFGSLVSYYIGYYGGNPLVKKFGKFFLVSDSDLEWTEQYFKNSGEKTIFIARFIPVVRHLISIPAGIGKMDLKKFCIYTFAGATIWCAILTYLGYYLGKNWNAVHAFVKRFDLLIIAVLLALMVFFIIRHVRKHGKKHNGKSKKSARKSK